MGKRGSILFLLRDLPKPDVLVALAERYGRVDASALAVFVRLLRVASDALTYCEAFLAENGLSQSRFTVLMLLRRSPELPQSPSDLAVKAGVTRPTMTGLVDGLEREGLVLREPDPTDRRRRGVRLTARGERLLDDIVPGHLEHVAAVMDGLDPQECEVLHDLLARLGPHAVVTQEA